MMSEQIEGVPAGWRLVRISKWPKVGEYAIYSPGEVVMVAEPDQWELACIVEKIEQPKQYRQFANAAEFEQHRDRWIKHPDAQDRKFKVIMFDDCGVCCYERRYSYAHLFECGTVFDDGSPFGMEVTE